MLPFPVVFIVLKLNCKAPIALCVTAKVTVGDDIGNVPALLLSARLHIHYGQLKRPFVTMLFQRL